MGNGDDVDDQGSGLPGRARTPRVPARDQLRGQEPREAASRRPAVDRPRPGAGCQLGPQRRAAGGDLGRRDASARPPRRGIPHLADQPGGGLPPRRPPRRPRRPPGPLRAGPLRRCPRVGHAHRARAGQPPAPPLRAAHRRLRAAHGAGPDAGGRRLGGSGGQVRAAPALGRPRAAPRAGRRRRPRPRGVRRWEPAFSGTDAQLSLVRPRAHAVVGTVESIIPGELWAAEWVTTPEDVERAGEHAHHAFFVPEGATVEYAVDGEPRTVGGSGRVQPTAEPGRGRLVVRR